MSDVVFERPSSLKAQADFFDDDISRYPMLTGGFGGGKTHGLWYKLVKLSWLNKGLNGGIICPSLPEFKRDVLPLAMEMKTLYVPNLKYLQNGREGCYFQFPWSTGKLFVFTAERPAKGPNLAYGGLNEFSLMPWERVREFMSRVRIKAAKVRQTCFAGTPEDEHLWLEGFVEKQTATKKLKIYTVSSFDNPFNADDYAQELLDNLDSKTAEVYVYGKMARLGRDYFYYAYDASINDFDIEYDKTQEVIVGMDFNVGRMSAIFAHIYGSGSGKQIGVFDEVVLTDKGSNTEQMARYIKERFGTDGVGVYCDSSGSARKSSADRTDIEILESHGFKVHRNTQNPRLRESQKQVNGLLERRRILINKRCKGLKRDLLKVEQGKDFEQKTDPKGELTHLGDCLRYPCWKLFEYVLDRKRRQAYHSQPLGGQDDFDARIRRAGYKVQETSNRRDKIRGK